MTLPVKCGDVFLSFATEIIWFPKQNSYSLAEAAGRATNSSCNKNSGCPETPQNQVITFDAQRTWRASEVTDLFKKKHKRVYPFEVNESWRQLKARLVYLHTTAHVEKAGPHLVCATNLNERSNGSVWDSAMQFEGQMFSPAVSLPRSLARLWVMSSITEGSSSVIMPNKWKSGLKLSRVNGISFFVCKSVYFTHYRS